MTKTTEIVWRSTDGSRELLKCKGQGKFYMPLSDCDEAILRELREAIDDALADPMVSAIQTARKGGAA